MSTIQYECPNCHGIIAGDDSSFGHQVKCTKCHAVMLVPQNTVMAVPPTARLILEPGGTISGTLEDSPQEKDIIRFSPTMRAFPGQLMLSVLMLGLGAYIATHLQNYSLPQWVPLIPLMLSLLLFLVVWIQKASRGYRLTNQRLFVNRGWLAKNVNELELYRVEDVQVDQGFLQRVLGYGTITVLAADVTTPQVRLVGVPKPVAIKEMIRTQYRASRKREGVSPTEFMQSPNPSQSRAVPAPSPSSGMLRMK